MIALLTGALMVVYSSLLFTKPVAVEEEDSAGGGVVPLAR